MDITLLFRKKSPLSDESLPSQIARMSKGETVTFTGRLLWEADNERGSLTLFAFKAEPYQFEP